MATVARVCVIPSVFHNSESLLRGKISCGNVWKEVLLDHSAPLSLRLYFTEWKHGGCCVKIYLLHKNHDVGNVLFALPL